MKDRGIHTLRPREGFEWDLFADAAQELDFDGSQRLPAWTPPRAERMKRSDEGKVLKPSDVPFGINELVVSEKAIGRWLYPIGERPPAGPPWLAPGWHRPDAARQGQVPMTLSIHTLAPPGGFEWLLPTVSAHIDRVRFDGSSRARTWTPVHMTRMKEPDRGKRRKPSDFPFGTNELVVSRPARDALREVLESHGEILPLACDDGEFWIVNVTTLAHALDLGRSDVMRADEDGRILMLNKPIFRNELLEKVELFKLPEIPVAHVFVTGRFVDRVRGSGLVGLDFKQVG